MTMTKEVLQKKVEMLNRLVQDTDCKFVLNYAYDGVRLCKVYEHGGVRGISERMSKAQMGTTLDSIINTIHEIL